MNDAKNDPAALLSVLKAEEADVLRLRRMYEGFGYRKYKMSQFEEYDLYQENRSFLRSAGILTFTDSDGRLMALKPDITLSIVKNTKATPRNSEKLYYLESVYQSSGDNQYLEQSQLGLEYIGDIDLYALSEVLTLACGSLSCVSPRYALSVSHMNFLVSFFDHLNLPESLRRKLLDFLRGKNAHELRACAVQNGLSEEAAALLMKICALSGRYDEVIPAARDLCVCRGMSDALDELYDVCSLLPDEPVTVDFSVAGDMDYYSGILFQGYLEGVPRAVLSGGSYDHLMRKFGKDVSAIGFALYLSELARYYPRREGNDVDALLLYDRSEDPARVRDEVRAMCARGLRVRASRSVPDDIKIGKIYRLSKNGVQEETADA